MLINKVGEKMRFVLFFLVLVVTLPLSLGAEGDVLFQDNAEGTISNNWSGNTGDFGYNETYINYTGTAAKYIKNLTQELTTGNYSFNFTLNDNAASISGTTSTSFGLTNASTLAIPSGQGNKEMGLVFESGPCTTYLTTYHVDKRGFGDCPAGTAVARTTGVTRWMYFINLDADQVNVYKNDVNIHNYSIPSDYVIRSIYFYSTNQAAYKYTNITLCEGTGCRQSQTTTTTTTISNFVNGTTLNTYCVSYTGNGTGNECTTNGTIQFTNVTGDLTFTFYNITDYYNTTITQTINEGSNSLITTTYQALLNVSAYRLFLNTTISTFNTTNDQAYNETTTGSLLLPANVGSNTLQTRVQGNYTINTTCTVTTPRTTNQCNVTGIYDNKYVFTAYDQVNATSINTFNVTGVNNTYSQVGTTTNGTTTLNLLQGFLYNFTFRSDGYQTLNALLPTNASSHSYQFQIVPTPSLNISFYDEETGVLITNSVIVSFVSTDYATNKTTTTGSLFELLGAPGDYQIRYSSTGYDERFYDVTLSSIDTIYLNLTLLNSSSATTVTVKVIDTISNPIENARVKVQKYDVTTNTYDLIQTFDTNFEGQGTASLELNSDFYRFVIEYNDATVYTSNPTQIYGTTLTFVIDTTPGSGLQKAFTSAGLQGNITFTPDTFRYSYNDKSNTASQACLTVYTLGATRTQYNQTCSTSASGVVTASVVNQTGTAYLATGEITVNGVTYTTSQLVYTYAETIPDDGTVLLMMFLMILTFMFALSLNIEIAVITASAVPFLFRVMELTRLDMNITVGVLAAGVVIAFIIGVVRR